MLCDSSLTNEGFSIPIFINDLLITTQKKNQIVYVYNYYLHTTALSWALPAPVFIHDLSPGLSLY
jgi:hypothetical protein